MKLRTAARKMFVASGAFSFAQKLSTPSAVILRYHSIQDDPEQHNHTIGRTTVHATSIFARQIELIAKRFSPVSMDDIALFLKGEKALPRRAVAITFDDGFKDNFSIAAPILNRYGIPGTFYLLVGAVDQSAAPWYCVLRHAFMSSKKTTWRDPATNASFEMRDSETRESAFLSAASLAAKANASEREHLVQDAIRFLEPEPFPDPHNIMMTWDDARKLANAGHIIGSHTMTHPNLAHVEPQEAHRELKESKEKLEKELGRPVHHFAYPHPALDPQWNETTLAMTRELGYTAVVTTTIGAVRAGVRPLTIPRTYIPRVESDFLWHLEKSLLVGGSENASEGSAG